MAAYHRVYDSRHLQADCQEPGSAPESYALQSITGYLYLFLHLANASALPTTCGHINPGNVSRRHANYLECHICCMIAHLYNHTPSEIQCLLARIYQYILPRHTHTHPFNGPLSRTTRVSRYQKAKTNLDFTEIKRQRVAVEPAGPYASLHLAPDR